MSKQNKLFNTVEHTNPTTNQFDLSHDRKYSTKMGRLTPMFVMDTVPGDKISIKTSTFLRFAPMIAPVMHQVNVFCHFFFVPNRLLWDGWEAFITGGETGQNAEIWPHLNFDLSTNQPSSLHDYLGLPVGNDIIPGGNPDVLVSAFPFVAYQLIWHEYFRDENLFPGDFQYLQSGLNANLWNTIQNRAWQHDYFTSAQISTQKGPEALLPLGTTAPIVTKPFPVGQEWRQASDGLGIAGAAFTSGVGPPVGQILDAGGIPTYVDIENSHEVDLSTATAASINDLRKAMKLQEWLEKNQRGGSRYIESIKVHFGVTSSDARLQRPEYLGGSSQPVKISEVLQTTPSDIVPDVTPQGNMSGHGVSVGSGDYVSKYCEEHGYIIGIMSVLPKPAYQQGIPRHFSRSDKFDYFWPEFANIGEQPILNQELAISDAGNENTFGYAPRYAEYKFLNSTVHGDYKETLDFWHLGRKFATAPALNGDFITMDNAEIERIFAVQTISGEVDFDNLWCHTHHEVKAQRKMPVYGTPDF